MSLLRSKNDKTDDLYPVISNRSKSIVCTILVLPRVHCAQEMQRVVKEQSKRESD